ncbi:MAG: DinB family protein [Chitinophagales bacterium]|nr:DinB family protein [Chitinophagales bacterium]MDW8394343.1 DinB family protein [Chitinophagales bacterium]
MKEVSRISKLFADQSEGQSWLGFSLLETLNQISAKEAASRPFPGFNSIWETVSHLLHWRQTVLRRLQGETVEVPEDNYFSSVSNRSDQAWQQLLQRFRQSTQDLLNLIGKENAASLSRMSTHPPFTRYELLLGLLQHEAYHLGQIRLLHRLARFRG